MGWEFSLKYANVVAYILAPEQSPPPRLTSWELREFLGSVQGEYRAAPPLISSDKAWIQNVKNTAEDASRWLKLNEKKGSEFLEADTIEGALFNLKQALGHYELIGLAVGGRGDIDELQAFIRYAAYSSGHHAIFLMPDLPHSSEDALTILDPFPSVAMIAEQPENWPGVLFWSRRGSAAFAPISEAPRLYQKLLDGFKNGEITTDRIIDTYRSQKSSKKILHLSDLHFGTIEAVESEAYLSACLEPVISTVNRVVITGDLFNNPRREEAIQFRNFRASLSGRTGKDVLVVPGNHDQKWLGNFGSPLRELANLEWSSLVVDDDMRCVFFCFDSSRDADLARGRVTRQQMLDIATLYETKAVGNPDIREYLSVSLIHHHPFSFDSAKETRINRLLGIFGTTDEYFLRMDKAHEFLVWCAKRKSPLILHGHKHVPRYVTKHIKYHDANTEVWRKVTAVGCGTSLGADQKPISYNVLTWDSSSNRWAATFYSDPGDGSGFARQYVALRSAA